MVVFRFGVILTPECLDIEVFVLGSRPEMGHWDPDRAVRMSPSRAVLSSCEPCLWVGDVRLSEPHADTELWFKFIKRVDGNYIWEGTWRWTSCEHDTNTLFGLNETSLLMKDTRAR